MTDTATSPSDLSRVAVVAIGRNEGDRLKRCLRAVPEAIGALIYVDSGSNDGSIAFATSIGATVVELDRSIPFTAGRARDEGVDAVRQAPNADTIAYIQFIDGDCELQPGWLDTAARYLNQHEKHAVVSGRRRERHPEASIYNALIDIEWDTPIGPAQACHGDAMIRLAAYDDAGRFRHDLIAGEEPELSLRLRRKGWSLERLDHEMTLHDADMHRFGQWWKRGVRAGYAMAEGVWMHGGGPERYNIRRLVRTLVWVAAIPLLALALTLALGWWGLLVLAFYPAQFARFAWRERRRGIKLALAQAGTLVLSKFAGAHGALTFLVRKLRGQRIALIEYKSAENAPPASHPTAENGHA